MDDLKISHVDKEVVEEIIMRLNDRYGKETPISVHRGPVQEYLGMTIDITVKRKVSFSMPQYKEDLLLECSESIMKGTSATQAANHLFQTNANAEKIKHHGCRVISPPGCQVIVLGQTNQTGFINCHLFSLYQDPVPDVDDFKKLGQCLRYLRDSKH